MSNTVALDKTIFKNKKRSIKRSGNKETQFGKYVDIFRKLLLLNEKNDLSTTLKNIQELMSFSEKIFSSGAVSEAFLYFCLHGASTAWVLQCELNMPEATVYRALKRLRAMRVIVPALKVSKVKRSKGGPRPTVWAIDTASPDEVSKALKHHYKMLSPKFRVAEEVAQTILDEFAVTGAIKEVNYRDIMTQVKVLKIPFKGPDIAELAAQYLHEKGIKVWR